MIDPTGLNSLYAYLFRVSYSKVKTHQYRYPYNDIGNASKYVGLCNPSSLSIHIENTLDIFSEIIPNLNV